MPGRHARPDRSEELRRLSFFGSLLWAIRVTIDQAFSLPGEPMALNPDTLERLVPDQLRDHEMTGRETLRIHLERYEFAARHARPGRLLDMACGVGYGTRLLAEEAAGIELALGVDISRDAIEYASGRYAGARTVYQQGDALTFKDPEGFDTIVSLETIEHVTDPEALLDRLARLLKPGAVLISSVPTTPSVDINPHHLHDFTPASLRAMLRSQGLKELAALEQTQKVSLMAVAGRTEARTRGIREHLVSYYFRHPGSLWRRIGATLRHGLCNKYLTIVAQKDRSPDGT